MKALTISQPWAWAIASGYSCLANCDWVPQETMIGQRIAIHASKRIDLGAFEFLEGEQGFFIMPDRLIRGSVIALATLAGVATKFKNPAFFLCNPWFRGPVAWILYNVQKIEPVRVRGHCGLWDFDESTTVALNGAQRVIRR